nr:calcium-activated potassium channel subunit beta-1 isoform X3 [Dasypus novemcinctus]
MFGHGGSAQMRAEGASLETAWEARLPAGSGSLFWGGGWGPGREKTIRLRKARSGTGRVVWTQESTCRLIESSIRHQEELKGRRVPQFPCLWVNVSAVGRWAVLYHTEDTRDQNQQGPGSLEESADEGGETNRKASWACGRQAAWARQSSLRLTLKLSGQIVMDCQ